MYSGVQTPTLILAAKLRLCDVLHSELEGLSWRAMHHHILPLHAYVHKLTALAALIIARRIDARYVLLNKE
jgi:hypothetical protein